MAKGKKKVKIPEGACPLCLREHSNEYTIHPEIPDNPNLIVLCQSPCLDDVKAKKPLSNKAGRYLRKVLKDAGAIPIFVYAVSCCHGGSNHKDELYQNKQLVLHPLLGQYHSLPVVALGALAVKAFIGGQIGDESYCGDSTEVDGHIVAFTYDMEYAWSKGDKRYEEEIGVAIKSALVPWYRPKFIEHTFPKDVKEIILDVEATTNEFPFYGSKLLCIGILPIGKSAYIIRPEEITDEHKAYLRDNVEKVVGHNINYDLVHLASIGITFPRAKFHDTMIYEKNMSHFEFSFGLKQIVKRRFSVPHWEAWFHAQLNDGIDLETVDKDKLFCYNAFDLYNTEQLYLKQNTRTCNSFLLEMDYLAYIREMITNGMHVKRKDIEDEFTRVEALRLEAEVALRKKAGLGEDFNFRSPQQLLAWLHMLGFKMKSTDEDSLLAIKGDNPYVDDLLNIRDLSKYGGTSLGGLLKRVDCNDLVHSSFAVHGAETSRSSSSKPNLQNTDPRVRPVYNSRYPGGKLVYADLSALEYRLIAHAANEVPLIKAFINNWDIHKAAYKEIFGRESQNDVERKLGKTNNYLGVYGGGYEKFLLSAGLPDCTESKMAYDRVTKMYPHINAWKEQQVKDLYGSGRVRNLFGRTREFHIPNTSFDRFKFTKDAREAVNWIIQSSGHDILKIFLMETADLLADNGLHECLLISEVHDSFTFDCPKDQVNDVYEAVGLISDDLTFLIEDVFGVKMKCPIVAEAKILDVWK